MDPHSSAALFPGHPMMVVPPELLSFFASGLHTEMRIGSSSSSPFARSQQKPIIDCSQNNSMTEEPALQLLSPNTPLDYNSDDLFSEGEGEMPQTPVRRIPLLRKCPGAPRKPRPVRKVKKGAKKPLRVLQADFDAAFPVDAAMIQRQKRRNRLLNAQQLLEQAIRC